MHTIFYRHFPFIRGSTWSLDKHFSKPQCVLGHLGRFSVFESIPLWGSEILRTVSNLSHVFLATGTPLERTPLERRHVWCISERTPLETPFGLDWGDIGSASVSSGKRNGVDRKSEWCTSSLPILVGKLWQTDKCSLGYCPSNFLTGKQTRVDLKLTNVRLNLTTLVCIWHPARATDVQDLWKEILLSPPLEIQHNVSSNSYSNLVIALC